MKTAIFILALLFSTLTHAQIDLREYFPASGQTILKTALGNDHARYTYYDNPAGYQGLYDGFFNQGKAGIHAVWVKEYKVNGVWCVSTHAVLFKGTDKSVTEVGDWTKSTIPCVVDTAFGYKKNGVPSGLIWSPAGGITDNEVTIELNVFSQGQSGAAYADYGYQAYSKSGLISTYASYTAAVSTTDTIRGTWAQAGTYNDVIKIVMYHGTKYGDSSPLARCENKIVSSNGAYYQSFKNYNSYAIVLWLAKGVGVVKEQLLYGESNGYWGIPDCSGYSFKKPYQWSSAIAQ